MILCTLKLHNFVCQLNIKIKKKSSYWLLNLEDTYYYIRFLPRIVSLNDRIYSEKCVLVKTL